MTIDTQIYQKVERLTPNLKKEVLDYIELIMKKQRKFELTPRIPVFGCAKDQFQMSNDFDAPLEDFKEYME